MGQSVCRRSPITQTPLPSQASPSLIFFLGGGGVGKVALGRVSLRVLLFSLAVIISLNPLTFHFYTTYARYQFSSSEEHR
jgi:hypothetical protein